MSQQEQNKRINQLKRQLANVIERIKTLELDIEPEGRISEAFLVVESHMDSRFDRIDSRLDRIEHQFNRIQAKIEVILDAITGITDLPEKVSRRKASLVFIPRLKARGLSTSLFCKGVL